MNRSKTYALQGAALVTLLLGTQSTSTPTALHHELSFDQYGRIVGVPAALAQEPGLEQDPGSIPNIKC